MSMIVYSIQKFVIATIRCVALLNAKCGDFALEPLHRIALFTRSPKTPVAVAILCLVIWLLVLTILVCHGRVLCQLPEEIRVVAVQAQRVRIVSLHVLTPIWLTFFGCSLVRSLVILVCRGWRISARLLGKWRWAHRVFCSLRSCWCIIRSIRQLTATFPRTNTPPTLAAP